MNFLDASDKIKELKSQFNQISQEAGKDIRDLEEFSILENLKKDITSKKDELKQALKNALDLFVQRDISNAKMYPTA